MISGQNLFVKNPNNFIILQSEKGKQFKFKISELNKFIKNLVFNDSYRGYIEINEEYLGNINQKEGEKNGIDMFSIIDGLTSQEKEDIDRLLKQIGRDFYFSHGLKWMTGAWYDYTITNYDDPIITVNIELGYQEFGDIVSYTQQYGYLVKIDRKTMEIVNSPIKLE